MRSKCFAFFSYFEDTFRDKIVLRRFHGGDGMTLYRKVLLIILAMILIVTTIVAIGFISFRQEYKTKIIDDYVLSKNKTYNQFLSIKKKSLENTIISNAKWTQLNDSLSDSNNQWVYENAAGYLVEEENSEIDYVLVIGENGYKQETGPKLQKTINRYIEMDHLDNELISSFYVENNGHIYWAIYTRITDNDYAESKGFYVLASKLDQEYFRELKVFLEFDHYEIITPNEILNKKDQEIVITRKLHLINSTQGILRFFFNPPELLQIYLLSMRHSLFLFIGLIFFLSVIVLYLIKLEADNILQTAKKIQQISFGDYNIVLDESKIYETNTINRAVNEMVKTIKNQINTIEEHAVHSLTILNKALEYSDLYTRGHSERVAEYAVRLSDAVNQGDKEVIRRAALLHDIGKIGIDQEILNKKGKLTKYEFKEIKRHPEIGYQILDAPHFEKIRQVILYHHRYLDGTGYPEYTTLQSVPIESQIISISDIYDALVTNRPYRKAKTKDEAIQILRDMAVKKLNKDFVEVFINEVIGNNLND